MSTTKTDDGSKKNGGNGGNGGGKPKTGGVRPKHAPNSTPAAAAPSPGKTDSKRKGEATAEVTPNSTPATATATETVTNTEAVTAPVIVKDNKRTKAVGRKCYDVTLKFYNELEHAGNGEQDPLVKWVVAPDLKTLTKWLEDTGLSQHLDGLPREMSALASETYGIANGVDVILGKKGEVVEQAEGETPEKWRQQVVHAAETHYDKKLKFKPAEGENPQEWSSGKYHVKAMKIGGIPGFILTRQFDKTNSQSLGDYPSLELAMVGAIKDAASRSEEK